MRKRLLLASVMWIGTLSSMPGPFVALALAQTITPGSTSNLEVTASERLAFDRMNEERKAQTEYVKAAITGLSVLIPFAAAIWLARAQARVLFELKAAELVLGSTNPFAARNRADILKKLFPKRLSVEFAKTFDPREHSRAGPSIESKLELLRLIAASPTREQELIALWRRMYPGDTLDRLFPGDFGDAVEPDKRKT